jgi:GTP cyclohydrolase I
MNAPLTTLLPASLPDVQSSHDARNIPIQRVGIKSVRYPVTVAFGDSLALAQPSIALIDMYVGLPGNVKGTHMSRFLEVLEAHHQPISFMSLQTLMAAMLERLDSDSGYIDMRLPYFRMKVAPVSGVQSLMDYGVTLKASQQNGTFTCLQQVLVPVTSLCPCSKDISAYGAHNQRSHVTIGVTASQPFSIDMLIRLAEEAASCELYGLLKRPDEKYVTERAYENPKFVEDLVRDIALRLDGMEEVIAYTVESENFESIHNHSAYARVEHDKRAPLMQGGG